MFLHYSESSCGERHLNLITKIIGGKRSKVESQPWIAAIFKGVGFICGGTLIAPCWVLTAAHCFPGGYVNLWLTEKFDLLCKQLANAQSAPGIYVLYHLVGFILWWWHADSTLSCLLVIKIIFKLPLRKKKSTTAYKTINITVIVFKFSEVIVTYIFYWVARWHRLGGWCKRHQSGSKIMRKEKENKLISNFWTT